MRTSMMVVLWLAMAVPAAAQSATCPRDAAQAGALTAFKGGDAPPAEVAARAQAVQALFACLASPDPALRDELAYTVLSRWMRERRFTADELRARWTQLDRQLSAPDPHGVARPFAALMLAEIARTDRIEAWMTTQERARMLSAAAGYLRNVDDYRGWVPGTGWHHGVAHAADWAMQLALDPNLQPAQLRPLLAAVQAQAVPATGHAYVFGEPERLLRPVYYAMQRGAYDDAGWAQWLDELAARLGPRPAAGMDAAWLGRRHDLVAFLNALYVAADTAPHESVSRHAPAVRRVLQSLPG